MNELQQVQFSLLKNFDLVCKKMDIKYFLVCGTALGAKKYGGFIPWDDDIDVAMFRKDYECFIASAQEYFPEEIFLQNYKTDCQFPNTYSKLRNSNTTYIEKTVEHINMNHGVYIDIFPLDGYPKRKLGQLKFECLKKFYRLLLSCAYKGEFSKKARFVFMMERGLQFHKKTALIIKKLESLYKKYPCELSDVICNHGNWQGKLEYASKAQYGNGYKTEFEGLTVLVPEKIDEYLTQKYGNWREDLNDDEKQGHHYYSICDLNKSYKYYLNK